MKLFTFLSAKHVIIYQWMTQLTLKISIIDFQANKLSI